MSRVTYLALLQTDILSWIYNYLQTLPESVYLPFLYYSGNGLNNITHLLANIENPRVLHNYIREQLLDYAPTVHHPVLIEFLVKLGHLQWNKHLPHWIEKRLLRAIHHDNFALLDGIWHHFEDPSRFHSTVAVAEAIVQHGSVPIARSLIGVLKYCRIRACARAAATGNLPMLQMLLEYFQWDTAIIHSAIRNQHWHVLQWTIEHGCPYNPYQVYRALIYGNQRKLLHHLLLNLDDIYERNLESFTAATGGLAIESRSRRIFNTSISSAKLKKIQLSNDTVRGLLQKLNWTECLELSN